LDLDVGPSGTKIGTLWVESLPATDLGSPSRRTAPQNRRLYRGYRGPSAWPGRTRFWTRGRVAATAIFCAFLMVFTSLIPNASASGGGGGNGGDPSSNATTPFENPYAVRPSMFPAPANLPSASPETGVAAIPLPGSIATYAVVNASDNASGNRSNATLWFAEASYSPIDAKTILTTGGCGVGCGQLPLSWSDGSVVATYSQPITQEGISSMGATLVIAASSGGSTYLYTWSTAGSTWVRFGPTIAGQFADLAADPEEVAVVSLTGASAEVTTVGADGTLIAEATIYPSGTGSTGVAGAGVQLTPHGAIYLESLVLSVAGSNQIQFLSSTDGTRFSAPVAIGNFSAETPNAAFSSVGQTPLNFSGGVPGQIAYIAVGPQLFVLCTTNVSGQTVPETESSQDNGLTWQGPYLAGPINGTVFGPALTVGPTGLVYATWEDPSYGAGAIDEAIYFPDGMPMFAPETLHSSSAQGNVRLGSPAIAVDGFSRPLVLWPSSSNTSGALSYSGGYLNASASLGFLDSAVGESLGGLDFPGGNNGSSPALLSLITNVTANAQSVRTNLTPGGLCAAQNLTARYLYQNVTHFPLAWQSGTGTVCAATLRPSTQASPLLQSVGADTPNTYLAVYVDWLLEAEGVPVSTSPLSVVAEFSPYTETTPSATLPMVVSNPETVNSQTVSVTVTPTPYSPTAYQLATTDHLPTWTKVVMGVSCTFPRSGPKFVFTYTTSVTKTWTNVSIDNGTIHPFTGTTAYPSVWIYDLPTYEVYYWTASFAALTTEVLSTYDPCDGSTETSTISPVGYGPASIPAMTLSGTFSTTLSATYGQSFITAVYNPDHSSARISTSFGTTLPATVSASLSNTTGTQFWNTTALTTSQSLTFPSSSGTNLWYTLDLTSLSRSGSSTPPGSPSFGYGTAGASPAESVWATCWFPLATQALPSVTTGPWGPYSNVNATTVDVMWYSSQSAEGFFTYYELGSAINTTISGINPVSAGSGTWEYAIELHGLEPWESYNGTYGVSWAQGCVTNQAGVTPQSFTSGGDPQVATRSVIARASVKPYDLPFDSITQTGGGFYVHWNAPPSVANRKVTSGALTISNSTSRLVVQFGSLNINQSRKSPWFDILNVSAPLTINSYYGLTLELNYSGVTKPIYNQTGLGFVYQQDTSGDGLTDHEKQLGWNVLLGPGPVHVSAVPIDYATNGLVSDYVEKEFGLNPHRLDSAVSHMLDTWNLTFDLGAASSAALPLTFQEYGIFQYYYENSSYNFSRACQTYSPGSGPCTFTPIAPEPDNLTWAGGETGWLGDGNPWAATQLWSTTALSQLESAASADGVTWLRAVTGHYGSDRTITVWGKLSWGADPLLTSTSGDGLADGNQPDPLGPVYVQINVSSWGTPVFQQYDEAALYVNVTSQNGKVVYHGWGPASSPPSGCSNCYINIETPYILSIPVTTAAQYADYNVSVVWNDQNNLLWLDSQPNTPLDLLNYTSNPVANVSWAGFSGGWPPGPEYENVAAHVLPDPKQANTLLLAPANNTTLSNLPWGLKRYTGEPDFDLIVLNVTNWTEVSGIEGTGWSYSVLLEPGLNNLLVPRGMFLSSPLGQALLNNSNETVSASAGSNLTFHASDWSSRSEASQSNTAGNPNFVWVFSTTNQLQNGSKSSLFTGIPSNPKLEAGYESRQVQAVIWVNVTSTGYGSSPNASAELTDLVGGLVLNSTGSVSGNLLNITGQLRALGLPSNIRSALATRALPNDGSFGTPRFNSPPPSSGCPWWNLLCILWNGVSGFLTTMLTAIWNAVIAAAVYLAAGAAWFSQHLGLTRLASQVVSVLKLVASAMLWAFAQVLAAIVAAAQATIAFVWKGVASLATGYAHSIDSSFEACESAIYAAANASGANGGLNLAAQTACVTVAGSIVGAGGIVQGLSKTFETIMSTLEPVLQYFSLSWITSRIEEAIGSVAPLGSALQYVNSIVGAASGGVASAVVGALDYAGASQSISNPSLVPGWLPTPSVGIPFMASGAGIGLPSGPSWLSLIASDLNTPGKVAVVASMAVATVLYGAWLVSKVVPVWPNLGAIRNFFVEESFAIGLTIVGWITLFVGGVTGYLVSILVDLASVGINVFEILTKQVEGLLQWAIAGADFGADAIDLGVCVHSLGIAL